MTNTIDRFNKQNLKQIHNEMLEAVQGVAEKYGISIQNNGGQMDTYKATLKFWIFASKGNDGVSAEQRDFEFNSQFYPDIKSEWFGKTFTVDGVEYEIAGINTRAKKDYIYLNRVKDGRALKCSPEYIRTHLEKRVVGYMGDVLNI